MAKLPVIQLPPALKERLAQGHPWIYRSHVPPELRLPDGTWARLRCAGWSGFGLWDGEGAIALRVFEAVQPPDIRWMREQIAAAHALRAPLRAAGTTAYRWLFGEGDGVPGLTVDRYGDVAIIQAMSPGVATLVDYLVTALRESDPSLRGVALRSRARQQTRDSRQETADKRPQTRDRRQETADKRPQTRDRRQETAGSRPRDLSTPDPRPEEDAGEVDELGALAARGFADPGPLLTLWGELPQRPLVVSEHGLRFQADLRAGQKTGLFLDQRENRRFVEGLSQGRSVLNCFSYTGAFSLYALRGGAEQVVSCDIGRGLAEAAEANIALNGLDAARHTFVTDDCFALLERYAGEGRRFDLLILDPPSFARNRQSRFAALRAYARINALAMRCVAPGGLLASASCTSQVGPEEFKQTLAAAGASAGRRMQIIHEAGQPLDHPVPAHFPEGRYLKFVVGRIR